MEKFILADLLCSEELEAALLATLMQGPEVFFSNVDLVSPELFHRKSMEFDALKDAYSTGTTPEPDPTAKPVPSEELPRVVESLRDLHRKRVLAYSLQAALETIRTDVGSDKVRALMESGLNELRAADKQPTTKLASVADLLPQVIRELKERFLRAQADGNAVSGLPTGIGWLDEQLGGLNEGLVILGAPPGAGKTTFALQLCRAVSQAGHLALFVTFEEAPARLAAKAISAACGLELKRFQDALSDPEQLETEARRIEPELRGLFILEGSSKLSVPEIKARYLQARSKAGARRGIIVIDYLQRACSALEGSGEYRHLLDQMLGQLREVALELQVPMIIIAAQNRSGQGTPSLTSFRDSSGCEYSADVALLLCENTELQPGSGNKAVDLVIAKNRFGATGKTTLLFNPALGVFTEAT